MKHGLNCDCDECFRINANEEFPLIHCVMCDAKFESQADYEDHWEKEHKKITAEELEEKFDNGEDVLEHFDLGKGWRGFEK